MERDVHRTQLQEKSKEFQGLTTKFLTMQTGDVNKDVVIEKSRAVDRIMNDAISIASGSDKDVTSSVGSSR
jgi:hypothetical protein